MKVTTNFRWAIQGQVATGPRPGFAGRLVRQVSRPEVDAWIQLAKKGYGVRSIICLLRKRQLQLYAALPELLDYYRLHELQVEHVPVRSGQKPVLSKNERKQVWKAFKNLKPPVLIHCSAGKTRSRAAAAYIKKKLSAKQGPTKTRSA